MAANKKYYELDETQHIEDSDLFAIGRGLEEAGTLSITAKILSDYIGSGAFDSNRQITRNIQGLVGFNANKANVKDFLDAVFFPAIAPEAVINILNPIREVGGSLDYSIEWSVVKKTNPITLIVVDGQNIPAIGGNQAGTKLGSVPAASGTYAKTINVSDGTLTIGKTVTLFYLYKIFFGPSVSQPTDSSQVRALSGSIFSNGIIKTFTLNTGDSDRIFSFALPDGVQLSSVVDIDALNLDLTSQYIVSSFMVLDAGGNNKSYNVYTLTNAIDYSSNHRHVITLI